MPGFIEKLDELRRAGADAVVILAVNDSHVMKAWGRELGIQNKPLLSMIADGSCELTSRFGLVEDMTDKCMGRRCKRFALVVEDGVVRHAFVEAAPNDLQVATAEHVLEVLCSGNGSLGASGSKMAGARTSNIGSAGASSSAPHGQCS